MQNTVNDAWVGKTSSLADSAAWYWHMTQFLLLVLA